MNYVVYKFTSGLYYQVNVLHVRVCVQILET